MRYYHVIIAGILIASMASCGGKNADKSSAPESAYEAASVADSVTEVTSQKTQDTQTQEKSAKEDETVKDVVLTRMVSNGKPSVIDFSATWCGPCKMMKPIFHKLAAEFADKYNFITIDIDENPALAEKYHIQAVPTFVFIDADGEEGDRIKGAVKESELREMLRNPAWF